MSCVALQLYFISIRDVECTCKFRRFVLTPDAHNQRVICYRNGRGSFSRDREPTNRWRRRNDNNIAAYIELCNDIKIGARDRLPYDNNIIIRHYESLQLLLPLLLLLSLILLLLLSFVFKFNVSRATGVGNISAALCEYSTRGHNTIRARFFFFKFFSLIA